MTTKRANINFYLKPGKENKSGERSLIMRITFSSKRVIFFLNEVVHPRYWSSKKQRVKPPKEGENDNNFEYLNKKILLYKTKAENAITQAIRQDLILSAAYFKNFLSGEGTEKEDLGFFDLFDRFIEVSRSEKSQRTILGYGTVKNFFTEFEQKAGYHLDLNSLDQVFFDRFKEYCFLKREPVIQQNYFAKIVTVLKTLLNWSVERGYYRGNHFKKFRAGEVKKEIIYLEPEEFKRLYEFPFESVKLGKVRDIFCFACLTGLRYSDLVRLRKEHLKEDYIQILEQKNSKSLRIPLIPLALDILKKYEDLPEKLLPVPSMQKLNEYIKLACDKAGIKEPVVLYRYFGNRKEEFVLPKHKVVTIHAARKTFITMSFILGMDHKTVKSITGHTKDSTFDKYLKISDKFKQEKMMEAWNKL